MRLAGVQNTYPPHHLHTIAFERDVVAERLETSRALSTRIAVGAHAAERGPESRLHLRLTLLGRCGITTS